MKLGNPPVVEAWIEFRFTVGEEALPWDEAQGGLFLDRAFEGRYRVEALLGRTELVLESTGGRPSIKEARNFIELVRAVRSDSDERYLQVGRGLLICNLVRKQQTWPDFEVLRDEALDAFSKYCSFFRPKKLLAAAMHYRDVVPVPVPVSGEVDIREYVTLYPEVPAERFGRVGDFRMLCTLDGAVKNGVLTLSVRRERQPPKPKPDGPGPRLRLRMDWNVTSTGLESTDPESIRAWLLEAHRDLLRAFRSAFTEKGWRLFDPQEE